MAVFWVLSDFLLGAWPNRPGRQEGPRKVKMTQMCHNLTFPGPSCRPCQIFMVQNGWYRCPAYSTTCFMFDSHLSPKQHSKRSSWKRGDGLEKHERTIFLPSALVWLYERGAEKVEAISILLFQQKSFLQQGN